MVENLYADPELGGKSYSRLRVAIVVSKPIERTSAMYICYVDESGDLGALPLLPSSSGNDQPVLVLGALFVETSQLEALTNEFLNLKYRFFPGLAYPSMQHLDRIIPEIKGADLRSNALRGNRNQQRQAYGFIDKVLGLLEAHHVRLVSRIWIKGLGQPFDSRAVLHFFDPSHLQLLRQFLDGTRRLWILYHG